MDKIERTHKMLYIYHIVIYAAALIPAILYNYQYTCLILLIVGVSAGLLLQLQLISCKLAKSDNWQISEEVKALGVYQKNLAESSQKVMMVTDRQKDILESMVAMVELMKDLKIGQNRLLETINLAAEKKDVNTHRNDKRK